MTRGEPEPVLIEDYDELTEDELAEADVVIREYCERHGLYQEVD